MMGISTDLRYRKGSVHTVAKVITKAALFEHM
jgi:hypothetical protein